MTSAHEHLWTCKVGGPAGAGLPPGADNAMRAAVEKAYREITGQDPEYIFSGWGGADGLTEQERAVVEDREPDLSIGPYADPDGDVRRAVGRAGR